MGLDDLNVLAAFLTVAKERSFTRAAKRLGVSRSGLSHAVRGLEERLGVRLLARTTRSVAPTEAGEQLISRLDPALGEVESVLDQIVGLRERPTGRVRLLVTPLSSTMVLAPMIRAAMDGLGLTFSFEEYVAPQIASGALVRVLEDWCPPFAGYFLYHPSRRQQSAALSALIETLRL